MRGLQCSGTLILWRRCNSFEWKTILFCKSICQWFAEAQSTCEPNNSHGTTQKFRCSPESRYKQWGNGDQMKIQDQGCSSMMRPSKWPNPQNFWAQQNLGGTTLECPPVATCLPKPYATWSAYDSITLCDWCSDDIVLEKKWWLHLVRNALNRLRGASLQHRVKNVTLMINVQW